jgi:hypothetical protein
MVLPYQKANAAPVFRSGVAEEPLSEVKAVLVATGGGFSLSPREKQTRGGNQNGGADGP